MLKKRKMNETQIHLLKDSSKSEQHAPHIPHLLPGGNQIYLFIPIDIYYVCLGAFCLMYSHMYAFT